MDEKEAKTENKEETVENNDDGVQQQTISELDRADQIAERMARENQARKEILDREEALEARRRVGGVTEAGQIQEKPKEETPKEYKDRVMKNEV